MYQTIVMDVEILPKSPETNIREDAGHFLTFRIYICTGSFCASGEGESFLVDNFQETYHCTFEDGM